jgi:hypothetical protein
MNEKTLKWLAFMIILGAVVVSGVLLIDLKLKNDLVHLAMNAERDLQMAEAYARTGVPNEQESTGPREGGNPDIRGMPGNLPGSPVSGDDAIVEAPGPISQNGAAPPQKGTSEPSGGNPNPTISQSGE